MNVLAYVHLRNIHRSTGAGRVARELVEHLSQRKDVNLHILADEEDYRTITPKVGSPWNKLPCHLFKSDTSAQQAKWILLQRPATDAYWPKADITHCTMESYVPKAKSRLVVTIHDAAYFDGGHQRSLASYKQQVKWRILYSTLARNADIFHTVSHFSAERLSRTFPEIRSRIRVVYNAVSSIFFSQETKPLDGKLAGRPYVLVPGGLHYRKNADLILKAWPVIKERTKDALLVVAGNNSVAYLDAARQLGPSVILTGYVDDGQLSTLYKGAKLVWFPSRYEGFGLPVLEAMASGTPVLASDCTSIPEISGGAAMLVRPDCIEEHIDAVNEILANQQLAASLSEKGRLWVKPFTWGRSASQLHHLYSEVA